MRFGLQSCPKCSKLALFLEPLLHQNRPCKRNLDFSKNAFSPRREHSKSQIVGQLLMRMCFRIASETQCELTSLLVAILAPNLQIWGPLGDLFGHLFGIIFAIRFKLNFFLFFLFFYRSWEAEGRVNPTGVQPIPPVLPPWN